MMELNTKVDFGEDDEGLIFAYFYDEQKDYCFSLSRFSYADDIEIMVSDQLNHVIENIEIKIFKSHISAFIPEKLSSKLDGRTKYKINFECSASEKGQLISVLKKIFINTSGLSMEIDNTEEQAKEYLDSLSNKQLVEFLTNLLQQRRSDEGVESAYLQAHWCLAQASRSLADNGAWEEWQIELLANHDSEHYKKGWVDDVPICQSGECKECHMPLLSWAKDVICPVCGNKAYAT